MISLSSNETASPITVINRSSDQGKKVLRARETSTNSFIPVVTSAIRCALRHRTAVNGNSTFQNQTTKLMTPTGIEPATFCSEDRCSAFEPQSLLFHCLCFHNSHTSIVWWLRVLLLLLINIFIFFYFFCIRSQRRS